MNCPVTNYIVTSAHCFNFEKESKRQNEEEKTVLVHDSVR